MLNERILKLAAFFEWRVAKAYSTGTTLEIEPRESYVRHSMLSASMPSHKWIREELGFGLGYGPSLAWTCRVLDKTNRDACKMLGAEAPYRYQWPVRRA